MFTRHANNPLITPAQLQPSRPDFEVIGTFNAGVTEYKGEVILLVRVAERPISRDADTIYCPYLTAEGGIAIKTVLRHNPDYQTNDQRVVKNVKTGETFLTSISHLRLARSRDGVNFILETHPWIAIEAPFETFGMEDARITCIDDMFYINYTAVSPYGIATGLLSTRDFITIQRHGLIFPPSNRDVVIFPQKINDSYVCYHRPMPGDLGNYNIWGATSPDLIHWGGHQVVLESAQGSWDSGRIGGGAPPLWTERGWLSIYHAADRSNRYCLGVFITPHDEPMRITARSTTPILVPEANYEVSGFFGNVVFTCGALISDGVLRLYYGTADEAIALAEAPLDEVLALVSS